MTKRHYLKKASAVGNSKSMSYTMNQIVKIYNFPTVISSAKKVIGVLSFGGGLFGTLNSSGVLTNGDVQQFWSSLGISQSNFPQVIVVPINGATNNPVVGANENGTTENTIDVETIGAVYPSSNLTIILYIAPPTSTFYDLVNYVLTKAVVVNGLSYSPSVISISWGCPEVQNGTVDCIQTNGLFAKAVSNGITICAASGDNGSSDGISGVNADFPSSSPNVVACGGTTLVCPSGVYDSNTKETVWSGSGGGFSILFQKPSYQSNLKKSAYRSTPDIAFNADPNTGVLYLINGQQGIIGGTSIVAPLMSAYIALTNPVGFINTKIYSSPVPSPFYDITTGNNGAYSASVGYDNCTGWGSFNGILFAIQTPVQTPTPSPVQTPTPVPSPAPLVKNITLPLNYSYKIASINFTVNNSNVTFVNGFITGVSIGTSILKSSSMIINVNVIPDPLGWIN